MSHAHDVSIADLEARRHRIKLSILMPAYNEDQTIAHAVDSVLGQDYPCPIELVVVDDGSVTPVTRLLEHIDDDRLTVHRHEANLGKGAALRHAAALATGTHMVPFDADMEYDPADLPSLLAPVLAGRCDVVYGVRLSGSNTRFQSYRHGVANRFLTLAANVTFNAYITDLHTCLKLMPLEFFRSFPLREAGFGLDTEITARILRTGARPFEVPISYHSRSKAEGKKITWHDGVECLTILARVRRAPLREIAGPPAPPASAGPEVATASPPRVHRRRRGDRELLASRSRRDEQSARVP
jgi:glycosyltransferase involved in cell wall biosynthesis